jgi:VanZ family protein
VAAVKILAKKKFFQYLLPTILWAALIFFVSSLPGNKIPKLFIYQDVVFHTLEYAIFGWLIHRTIKNYFPGRNYLSCIVLTITASIFYALTDEFHQAFIPYRNPSLIDVTFDVIGATVGTIVFWLRRAGVSDLDISEIKR